MQIDLQGYNTILLTRRLITQGQNLIFISLAVQTVHCLTVHNNFPVHVTLIIIKLIQHAEIKLWLH